MATVQLGSECRSRRPGSRGRPPAWHGACHGFSPLLHRQAAPVPRRPMEVMMQLWVLSRLSALKGALPLPVMLAAAGLSLLAPGLAAARAVFDPADPAFAGSVTVSLPPPGLVPGTLESSQFTSNNATFRMTCPATDPCPVDGVGIYTGGSQGLVITITPPVSAIMVRGEFIDGSPGGIFVGSAGSE